MNKKLDIRKNSIILFGVNIIVLISMMFFKFYYAGKGYYSLLVNATFIVNIILLIFGVVYNILLVKNPDKYDNKLFFNVMIIAIIIYFLLNTVFVIFINKSLNSKYTGITEKLSSYCDTFGCDKYETITANGYKEFVIKKVYYDYDNVENKIDIVTKYDTEDVISVKATIYSRKEMYSSTVIRDELKDYFSNFGYDIKEEKIVEAFEKRFSSEVADTNTTYKVTEIYKDGELEKLKTIITLNLKQE